MLNSNGFDVWADGYDESVRLADESDAYPFAGYATILKEIYGRVCASGAKAVLDIGFGTGTLAGQLYQQGCDVFGQDFSSRMIQLAQGKMPRAQLYQGDFSLGLVQALKQQRYDAIIATYALHHLTDEQKVAFRSCCSCSRTTAASMWETWPSPPAPNWSNAKPRRGTIGTHRKSTLSMTN